MKRLPVLTYHAIADERSVTSISVAQFRAHVSWLHDNGWRSLTLDQLLHGLTAGSWPDRSIVLTFDDGLMSVVATALPILKSAGLPAIVFVIAAKGVVVSGARMDVAALREAHAAGLDVGSHAMTHVPLTSLPLNHARDEIVRSRAVLEEAISAPVRSFAYPFGDQSSVLVDQVRRTYDAGFSTRLAHAAPASDRASIERIDAFYLRGAASLAMLSSPRGRWWLAARRWARAVRG